VGGGDQGTQHQWERPPTSPSAHVQLLQAPESRPHLILVQNSPLMDKIQGLQALYSLVQKKLTGVKMVSVDSSF
jgi:hypothetical protein